VVYGWTEPHEIAPPRTKIMKMILVPVLFCVKFLNLLVYVILCIFHATEIC